jgi:hypothetical protein
MRLPTEIVVQALIRRCFSAGAAGYVVRHGDGERGALYLKISTLDGRARLLGPAPAGLDDTADNRPLVDLLSPDGVPERDAEAYMQRQYDFDPDLWLVEIEDRQGRSFLDS